MRFVFRDLALLRNPNRFRQQRPARIPRISDALGNSRAPRQPRGFKRILQQHGDVEFFFSQLAQRAFHGRAIPGAARESRIAEFDPQTVALKTDPQQQAAPKRKFRRLRAYGGSLPEPESPSPHRQPNSEREREFSSRRRPLSRAAPLSATALQKSLRQLKRNPATIHRQRRELHVPEIPHVFFRAQQRIGAAT